MDEGKGEREVREGNEKGTRERYRGKGGRRDGEK